MEHQGSAASYRDGEPRGFHHRHRWLGLGGSFIESFSLLLSSGETRRDVYNSSNSVVVDDASDDVFLNSSCASTFLILASVKPSSGLTKIFCSKEREREVLVNHQLMVAGKRY